MTEKELKLLRFIHDYKKQHNKTPSYGEMLAPIDIKSKQNVHRYINKLVDYGVIEKSDYKWRSITITPYGFEVIGE